MWRVTVPSFEEVVRSWTRPVNGQYPRPWMSKMTDPTRATGFIVGRNQATPFPVGLLPNHEAFVDALFNRNGQSHAELYERARAAMGKGPSPTRGNIERLTALLERGGVEGVLETNVICYSTSMSSDLRDAAHAGGKEAGKGIFRALLRAIQPRIIIAHGAATRTDLEKILGVTLPAVPEGPDAGVKGKEVTLPGSDPPKRALVLVIPALAPPGWNKWSSWAPMWLERLAERAAEYVRGSGPGSAPADA